MSKEVKNDKNDSSSKVDNGILELIRLIDNNKDRLFRWYDAFYGLDALLFVVSCTLPLSQFMLNTTSLIDRAVLILSFITLLLLYFQWLCPP